MKRLPRDHSILPYSVEFRIPGFSKHYLAGVETLAPRKITSEEWFDRFVDQVAASVGRAYLPICRISDGEFRFLLGEQPLGPVWPLSVRMKSAVKRFLDGLWAKNGFQAGGGAADGSRLYSSGTYSKTEWDAAREGYAAHLAAIAQEGILAVHLTHGTPQPFQQHYFPAFGRWLDANRVVLTIQNYVPFYFVYALLRGPRKQELLARRRVLVVHGATGEKRERITGGLRGEGVAEVFWQPISAERSWFDRFDCTTWLGKIDLCLVGAGVGKPNILTQLRPLAVPCIDAGYVFEVWADPARAIYRPFMVPDESPEAGHLSYFSAAEKRALKNR